MLNSELFAQSEIQRESKARKSYAFHTYNKNYGNCSLLDGESPMVVMCAPCGMYKSRFAKTFSENILPNNLVSFLS